MLSFIAIVLCIAALALAAMNDFVRYEIPDVLSLVVLGAFLLVTPALPFGTSLLHVGLGLAMLTVGAFLFALGIWGGGDVKLLAATSVWMGWHDLPSFLLLTAIAGAVLTALLIFARRIARGRMVPPGRWYSQALSETSGVPYGIAISLAGAVLLLQSAAAPSF